MDNKDKGDHVKQIATAYRVPESEVARALGQHLKSSSLDEAWSRYTGESNMSTDKPALLKELEQWIGKELEGAKTGEDHRRIFGRTPEESEMIMDVINHWDKATAKLLAYTATNRVPATRAHEIFMSARPVSEEFFRARTDFRTCFSLDLARAARRRVKPLLFKLIAIAEPARRREVEKLLLRFCRSRKDLGQLLPMLSESRERADVIRKLARFK